MQSDYWDPENKKRDATAETAARGTAAPQVGDAEESVESAAALPSDLGSDATIAPEAASQLALGSAGVPLASSSSAAAASPASVNSSTAASAHPSTAPSPASAHSSSTAFPTSSARDETLGPTDPALPVSSEPAAAKPASNEPASNKPASNEPEPWTIAPSAQYLSTIAPEADDDSTVAPFSAARPGGANDDAISLDSTRPSLVAKGISDQEQTGNRRERSLIGETIDSQYKIVSILGKGGMSVVYKAVMVTLNKTVAIKTLHSHLISDNNSFLRFRQEAQAASQLDHPHVIKVYSFGSTGGDNAQPYLVMDFIEGESLSEAMKRGRLPVRATVKICKQVCDALAHAHAKGVIHRDLKPSNIMLVERDGDPYFVKLVDFGIAKVLPQEGEQAHNLTQTGEIFGSPMYMSPEQCLGHKVDKRSDVYALGCVLYEALSGSPPHYGNNVFETFQKHALEIPAPLRIEGADKKLISRLDALVFRALEKQPDKRYQSMTDFENDLAAIDKEFDSGLRGVGFLNGISRQQRNFMRTLKNTPRVILATGFITLLLLGSSIFLWQKYSWFFTVSEHSIKPVTTHWFYFLRRRPKVEISQNEKQKRLDSGYTALEYIRLREGDSLAYLENWRSRAELCASLDAPKAEMEARKKVYDLEKKISGDRSQQFAIASESLGECELAAGNLRNATKHLRQAVLLRGDFNLSYPKSNILLGYALAQTGRAKEAITEFQKASKAIGNSDARLSALSYAMTADQVLVIGAESPQNSRIFLNEAENDYGKAEKVVAQSGKMKSLLSEINLMRAFVNLTLGNYQLACELYASAMSFMEKQNASQDDEMKSYLNAYSYCCFKTGDFLRALELHDRATAIGGTTATSSN